MQRNNKQFVYTMIITTVIGFIVLMIMMLWGLIIYQKVAQEVK